MDKNVVKLVGVDQKLIDTASELLHRNVRRDLVAREVFAAAVDTWLPAVVATIQAAQLVHDPPEKRRPRRFTEQTWNRLGAASDQVDVSRVALLRCCLALLAECGDDVEAFTQKLSARVQQTTKDVAEKLDRMLNATDQADAAHGAGDEGR